MLRGRWIVLGIVIASLASTSLAAAQLEEVGLRIDLTLQPFRQGGAVIWNFALGVFARIGLSEAWGARASLGFDLLSFGPYGSLGLLRAVGSGIVLAGNLNLQWVPHSAMLLTSADAGVLFNLKVGPSARLSLASFPLSWTIASQGGDVASALSFTPSLTVDGATIASGGLVIGGAVTLSALQVPSILGSAAVVPLGGGWVLVPRLTGHVGYAP